jgi:uridine kinase
MPRYDVNIREDNRDLRIKFMIGDFSEDDFKKKIQQREKARQRKTDIRQVVAMYVEVLNDLFQALVQTKDVGALADSLQELKTHVNTTLDAVSKRYTKCSVPRITENYDFV